MSTPLKLHFVVAGAGPAGLCAALSLEQAGHVVTVLEARDQLTMLGAGLTVQPSASKALQRFGLGEWMEERGVKNTKGLTPNQDSNGEVLGNDTTGNEKQEFGTPSYSLHRGHLVQELYNIAEKKENITIRFNASVKDVDCGSDFTDPFVTLSNGEKVTGDIVVGADGVKSVIRPVVTGQHDRASDTGQSAYRALISTSLVKDDPELANFIGESVLRVWLAPGRHLVAYNVSAMEEYNIVMLHETSAHSEESWTQTGDPNKMRALYSDFEPRIRKLLSLVETVYLWKLVDRPPISKWVHESGKVVVIGDACHPVLPYRAQGAGMAVEDADALGYVFSHITSKDEIKEFMFALQDLRASRCADAVVGARASQKFYQVPDGPEQEARDEKLRHPDEKDKHRFKSFYGYDTKAEVDAWWRSRVAKTN